MILSDVTDTLIGRTAQRAVPIVVCNIPTRLVLCRPLSSEKSDKSSCFANMIAVTKHNGKLAECKTCHDYFFKTYLTSENDRNIKHIRSVSH